MNTNSIRPMTEGGILAAIAVLFALMSAYVPVVGALIDMIWPVPIILLGVRHGYKWSIMALVVSGLLIAVLIHPLQAVLAVAGSGITGIVLGYVIRKNVGPVKTVLWGGAASTVSKVILLAAGAAAMGVDPFQAFTDAIAVGGDQAMALYRSLGVSEEMLGQLAANMQTITALIKIVLPAGLVFAAFIDTFLNLWVVRLVLRKMGQQLPAFPAIKHWNMPKYVMYLFLAAMLLVFGGNAEEMTMLKNIGMNLQAVFSLVLIVQGVAVFFYYADEFNWSKVMRGVLLVVMFSNGFFMEILLFIGVWDMVMDLRKLRTDTSKEQV